MINKCEPFTSKAKDGLSMVQETGTEKKEIKTESPYSSVLLTPHICANN